MEIKWGGEQPDKEQVEPAREVALEPGAGMPSLGFGGIHSFMSEGMLLTMDGHPQLRSVSLPLPPFRLFTSFLFLEIRQSNHSPGKKSH